MLGRILLVPAVLLLSTSVFGGDLADEFRNPPGSARPGVYWYFMDGNQDRDEMVADLEAMNGVGIGSVLFLEVNIGIPVGPVPFMSETWQDNLVHAIRTTERLGMEFILGTGPGWAGSGGSWVKPEDSMQHLVGSSTLVQGPRLFEQVIPVPSPHKANRFAGMTASHQAIRDNWFQDVAVLAFPAPQEDSARFDDCDLKTLKDVRPYSIRKADHDPLPFVMPQADYLEPDASKVVDVTRVIDLTAMMKPDGTLRWDVPEGNWAIMRFVSRSTGQTTRPAPRAGHGFECDKFNSDAYRRHWDHFQARILKNVGPRTPGRGLTTIHLDSWEMSSQNWSAAFRGEFAKRRGYDPQPWYPAFMGMVVGSLERTERFLWDMRKTSQELVLENHAGEIRNIAHAHGLEYSNEPYDMNPAGDLDLGSVADIPACEFWNARGGPDTQYSCIEAVSIAHTMGRPRVNAEAFTTHGMQFLNYPANMKNQTDWAFAMGINGIIFHTYQHQPLGDSVKPGMSMGPYGVQWHRNQTLWHLFSGYHGYIARSSHLLRQGRAVADILYLTPEGAPHIFVAPDDALTGSSRMKDKKGYNFDAVSPRILNMRAEVKGGTIAFAGGSHYNLLVLPDVETMTPETLRTVTELVKAGATVMGKPPRKSPSLVGFPACDKEVMKLSVNLWGKKPQSERKVGKGRILLNPDARTGTSQELLRPGSGKLKATGSGKGVPVLYPDYEVTARVLRDMGIPEDFQSDGPIRYGHRRTDAEDIYFVANTTDGKVNATCRFRVENGVPELWDPVTAEIKALPVFAHRGEVTSIPMTFEACQSFFVIFPGKAADTADSSATSVNFAGLRTVATLDGAWEVSFDPVWGGPGQVLFEELQDWTRHADRGIRCYSGSAAYRKTFDRPTGMAVGEKLYLDLGTTHDICRIRLNGKDLGIVWSAPWRVDITGAVKAEGNLLEIEVVNRWVNRLIGDQQEEDKDVRTLSWSSGLLEGRSFKTGRYTFTTHNPYSATSPLLPSGLLGPVKIMVGQP